MAETGIYNTGMAVFNMVIGQIIEIYKRIAMKFVDAALLKKTVSITECVDVMHDLFLLKPETEVINPLRTKMALPNNGAMLMMPAAIPPFKVAGIKLLTLYADNYKKGLSSHQGILHLFDDETGALLLSLDADEVTVIRTAAVSALATDLLAADDASSLAILGSGKQAVSHLEAMLAVRPVTEITVWSNNISNAQKFANEQSRLHNLPIRYTASVKEAVSKADIICTTTAAATPILMNEWIKNDAHINAIGACTPTTRELDASVMYNADVYIDNFTAAVKEAGDIILAAQDNDETDVMKLIKADLHQLIAGECTANKKNKTVFKSVGIGAEDVAFARHCYLKLQK